MATIAIAVHGGAGPDEKLIRDNIAGFEQGLKNAIEAGHAVLKKGGSAIKAVEAAVRSLEDDPLFNAGRGSALNAKGEIEMCASIMDGKTKKAGAVALVKNVKNPVSLGRFIMENTNHVLLSNHGALELARDEDMKLETDTYYVTTHQYDKFLEQRDTKSIQQLMKQRVHSTVGAVALDKDGNLAAATSSGGTTNSLAGRIGDSSIIGAGCYANNQTCAVSGTGDGEFLITGVIAHSISSAMEYTGCSMQQACDLVIHEKNKDTEGEMGVIAVDPKGNFGISFNSEHMHRAWKRDNDEVHVRIYK